MLKTVIIGTIEPSCIDGDEKGVLLIVDSRNNTTSPLIARVDLSNEDLQKLNSEALYDARVAFKGNLIGTAMPVYSQETPEIFDIHPTLLDAQLIAFCRSMKEWEEIKEHSTSGNDWWENIENNKRKFDSCEDELPF